MDDSMGSSLTVRISKHLQIGIKSGANKIFLTKTFRLDISSQARQVIIAWQGLCFIRGMWPFLWIPSTGGYCHMWFDRKIFLPSRWGNWCTFNWLFMRPFIQSIIQASASKWLQFLPSRSPRQQGEVSIDTLTVEGSCIHRIFYGIGTEFDWRRRKVYIY